MVEIQTSLSSDITSGLDALEKKIEGEVLLSGVAAMARVIYDEVKLNTTRHVKTGTLRDAVYRAYSPESSTDSSKVYHVSVNKKKAPHWHFLEYGTSRQAAQPYLRPAFNRIQDAIKAGSDRMKDRLEGGT